MPRLLRSYGYSFVCLEVFSAETHRYLLTVPIQFGGQLLTDPAWHQHGINACPHLLSRIYKQWSDNPELWDHLDCSKEGTEGQGSGVTHRPVRGVTQRPRGAAQEHKKTPVASVLPHSLAGDDIPAGPFVLLRCRAAPRCTHHNGLISASF